MIFPTLDLSKVRQRFWKKPRPSSTKVIVSKTYFFSFSFPFSSKSLSPSLSLPSPKSQFTNSEGKGHGYSIHCCHFELPRAFFPCFSKMSRWKVEVWSTTWRRQERWRPWRLRWDMSMSSVALLVKKQARSLLQVRWNYNYHCEQTPSLCVWYACTYIIFVCCMHACVCVCVRERETETETETERERERERERETQTGRELRGSNYHCINYTSRLQNKEPKQSGRQSGRQHRVCGQNQVMLATLFL